MCLRSSQWIRRILFVSYLTATGLLITPHIAWAAVEARTRLLQEVYKNLKAFQKGEKRNVCTG